MRIGYYHHAFPLLSETFVQREVEALRRAGVDVEVFSHEVRGREHFDPRARRLMETTHYLESSGDPVAALRRFLFGEAQSLAGLWRAGCALRHRPLNEGPGPRALLARSFDLASALRAQRIGHVHSPWLTYDATVAAIAADLAGISFSVQARASDIHRTSVHRGRAAKLRSAKFVITNTRYNETILRPLLPSRRSPVLRVIYNGLDLASFPAAPLPPDRPRIELLTVGRLIETKGFAYLLEACRLLLDAGRGLHCTIIGGSEPAEQGCEADLRQRQHALRLEGSVVFAGQRSVSQVIEACARADVFVFPGVTARDGRRDVTPNVVLEAMAMGRPVVASRSGGIPELIEDGVSGLLVPPGDAPALAAAIQRLADDRALRERLGAAARQRVEDRFDIDRNIRAYVELFTSLATQDAWDLSTP